MYTANLASCVSVTDAVLRSLSAMTTSAELENLMGDLCTELGFRHYALIDHADLAGSPAHSVRILDYPEIAQRRIIEEMGWRRDPVIRACSFTARAFSWSEVSNFIELDRHDRICFSEGVKAGLSNGITVPYLTLGECSGSCTFAGGTKTAFPEMYLGVAQMVGVFAFQAARRIAGQADMTPRPKPRLHPRPRDCVILAGRGMSNKEIARELGLMPRTVDSYLREARTLFEVHDRTELVVAALLAGEIGLNEIRRDAP